MKMTFRWFGTGHDPIPLAHIRQIPGCVGVITTLYDKQPGETWERDRIRALKKDAADNGLEISGRESVNVSDAIKAAVSDRDRDIETYIKTLDMLGSSYNFV